MPFCNYPSRKPVQRGDFHLLTLPHMPAVLPSLNKTASSKACRDSREQFYHMDTEEISALG